MPPKAASREKGQARGSGKQKQDGTDPPTSSSAWLSGGGRQCLAIYPGPRNLRFEGGVLRVLGLRVFEGLRVQSF